MGGLIWLAVLVGGIGWVIFWVTCTENGRKAEAQRKALQASKRQNQTRPTHKTTISQAGVRSGSGGLACPKCGGSQFKARRSSAARAAVITTGVAGALATKKTQVTCETCGTRFARG